VVGEPYDPAVWLDFVTGQGQLEPAVSNWQRAEVARWRQAAEDARAWQGRVFVAREFRDSPRDLLLLALSGE
jgi:hypothetical protein